MTDEERQLICAVLRQVGGYWYRHPDGSTRDCGKEAADEIERLAKELDASEKRFHSMTDKEYIAFRQRIADEQGTEFVAND